MLNTASARPPNQLPDTMKDTSTFCKNYQWSQPSWSVQPAEDATTRLVMRTRDQGLNPITAGGHSQPQEGLAHCPLTQSFVDTTALIASMSILLTQRILCKRAPGTILIPMDSPTLDAVLAEFSDIPLVRIRKISSAINSIFWKMDAIDMVMQCPNMLWKTFITILKLGEIHLMGKRCFSLRSTYLLRNWMRCTDIFSKFVQSLIEKKLSDLKFLLERISYTSP